MNVGPAVLAVLVAAALGLTVYAFARAFGAGHIGWALAILLLPGPGVLVAVLYLLGHPREAGERTVQ